jgi:hypothetical protein
MTVFVRARNDECASDLELDRLLAGEAATTAVRAHVEGCGECAARLAELEGERAAYRAAPFRAAPPPARRRGPWVAAAGGFALAAAALAFFVLRPPDGDATRAKGARRLGFYVKRGDEVWRGAPGERLRPGDRLRFTAALRERRYVAVLSLDAAGRASVYFPVGEEAQAVEPAAEALMPMSTVLDGSVGAETLYGLFCDAPIALAPVREGLEKTGAVAAPPGCELDVVAVDKRAAP